MKKSSLEVDLSDFKKGKKGEWMLEKQSKNVWYIWQSTFIKNTKFLIRNLQNPR